MKANKYMLKFNKLILLGLFCVCTSLVAAQKVLDKPVEKWSQSEAMEVLNKSAWTQTYQSVQGAAAASANDALRDQSDNRIVGRERSRSERAGGPAPVVMRLHSGLPIRLALTRLNQIAAGYDKMNDKAKAEFNDAGRSLLECGPCQNYYVLTLTKFPNPSGQAVEEAIFEGMALEQMKGNVWLKNDKGETRELAHFIPPAKRGDSAVFFFARKDGKGNVLVTKDNDEVSFVFNPNFFTPTNRFYHLIPRKFDFKVSKITVGDQVVF
jgi:hypothetical protein